MTEAIKRVGPRQVENEGLAECLPETPAKTKEGPDPQELLTELKMRQRFLKRLENGEEKNPKGIEELKADIAETIRELEEIIELCDK